MTSNVNTDDLEKFSSDGKLAGDCEVESMARELLAIREAGDKEVVRLAEEYQLGETEFHRIQTYKNLEGLAIARGRKLREAQAEIERLKRENDTLKEYFPSGAFEAKPQHEEGDGGYYDLFPGGLYQ